MDAESYSLHTFEALLSQSMEDLGKGVQQLPCYLIKKVFREVFRFCQFELIWVFIVLTSRNISIGMQVTDCIAYQLWNCDINKENNNKIYIIIFLIIFIIKKISKIYF